MINKYAGRCIRCGEMVLAGQGVLQFGNASTPWPWPEMRFVRNVPMTEHPACHDQFKYTGVHYKWQPLVEEFEVIDREP